MDKLLNKKDWPVVRFGDVVKNVNETERAPLKAGLERLVGLDCLDPENLRISRWGMIADGTSFTKRFRKGQVLFGKRRAYQRKVAVAEWDGICSGDILTFEPKDDKLLPELLPFIVQSDSFFEHTLGTSAGSLSPRTKWSLLKEYQFPLPPKEEQKRIIKILWAVVEVCDLYQKAYNNLVVASDSILAKFLGQKWPTVKLGDLLLDVQYGSSKRIHKDSDSGVPVLRIPNVIGGRIDCSDLSWTALAEHEVDKYLLCKGDILIVRTNGNPDYVGRTAVVEIVPRKCVYASYLIRLRCDSKRLLPMFLNAALYSPKMKRKLRYEIRSSAGNYNLNVKGIKRQLLPLPPIEKQEKFIEQLSIMGKSKADILEHLNQTKNLLKSYSSLIFDDQLCIKS